MPEVMYVGPFEEVDVPALDRSVKQGETVEVDDETADSLLEQPANWQAADGQKNVADIKREVGDDPDLARAALTAEQARSNPRKTLVEHLEQTIEAAQSGEEETV